MEKDTKYSSKNNSADYNADAYQYYQYNQKCKIN